MLNNNDIICISSIDWDFIWQGHQEIMSALANNGNRILFIENTGVRSPGIRDLSRIGKRFRDYFKGVKGIRRESDNLYIYSPIVLPFPYSRIARWINKNILLSVIRRWMRAIRFSDPIIWTFLPTGTAMDIIENINKKLLVYYCIDSFAASSVSAKKIKAYEKKLISSADLVFVTSKALYGHCAQYNERVSLFPFGVNVDSFEKARNEATQTSEELNGIKGPIIGYVGGIHKWIDQALVRSAAQALPDCTFVFVGPVQTDISHLTSLANVRFLGARKHSELPRLVKYFSVSLIPYLITDYTANVYPTKLNEYLCMGKPVVSTALPEVMDFNRANGGIVYVAGTKEEFIGSIREALSEPPGQGAGKRIEAARKNSWKSRIEEMSIIIASALEKKPKLNGYGWREEMVSFYRISRRKALKLFAAAVIAYLAVFYTPLAWYAAEPLRISYPPSKADAIVVFAGGVGESGRAGQGYLERVRHAVDLYDRGYAPVIVFSSGYTNVFKEADVMKAVAVSLGVPESSIILEERAKNTYENVILTGDILARKSWKKILVISSPYNMRRIDLVYKKNLRAVDAVLTPVPHSSFYAHRTVDVYSGEDPRQINIRQIKGILHEYLGIAYYWWKGYI